MQEFSLIERFCQNIGWRHSSTKIGVGDDAAVLQIPADMALAVSVDTMVEGVHFYPQANPAHLAHKLLAVNLSDMAAMGAQPKWATLALTLPTKDEVWLAAFSDALDKISKQYKVELIGGDTSQGPLVLSMQIMGLLPRGKVLTRGNARVGDDVYVSGTMGDAALALAGIQHRTKLSGLNLDQLRQALDRPTPQVELGTGLLNIANSCIDTSDGLVADLSHIATQSGVSIMLELERMPLSTGYKQYLKLGGDLEYAVSGGEDYQLAFTVFEDRRGEVIELARQLGIRLTKIGSVAHENEQPVMLQLNQKPYSLENNAGYQHFRSP